MEISTWLISIVLVRPCYLVDDYLATRGLFNLKDILKIPVSIDVMPYSSGARE